MLTAEDKSNKMCSDLDKYTSNVEIVHAVMLMHEKYKTLNEVKTYMNV